MAKLVASLLPTGSSGRSTCRAGRQQLAASFSRHEGLRPPSAQPLASVVALRPLATTVISGLAPAIRIKPPPKKAMACSTGQEQAYFGFELELNTSPCDIKSIMWVEVGVHAELHAVRKRPRRDEVVWAGAGVA